MQLLIDVFTSAAVAALLSTALIWLTKSVISERLKNAIKNEYDQKLETHKAELKSTSDIEIEKLKSQLSVIAAQGNFKFTKLHERRVDAIDAIHGKLMPVHDAIGKLISIFQPVGANQQDDLKSVETAYNEFKLAFAQNQIFLPRNLALAVERLNQTFLQVTNQFTIIVRANSSNPNVDVWMKLVERFQSEVNDALVKLREDMRLALGDNAE